MSDLVKPVTDSSFDDDVLKSDLPVLVDFWAEWCGPCKMIGPIVEEIAKEYQGRLSVAKLNVDENAAVPAKHGIRGIPTLILFKNGAVVSQKVGAAAKSQLTAWIDSQIYALSYTSRASHGPGTAASSSPRSPFKFSLFLYGGLL